MSIAHELSSDVAAAVLSSKEGDSPHDASRLAEVVREVHSTLRRLTADARRRTLRSSDSTDARTPAAARKAHP